MSLAIENLKRKYISYEEFTVEECITLSKELLKTLNIKAAILRNTTNSFKRTTVFKKLPAQEQSKYFSEVIEIEQLLHIADAIVKKTTTLMPATKQLSG